MSRLISDIAWPWLETAKAISDGRMLRGAFYDIQVVSLEYALYLYQWEKTATDITLHFVTMEGATVASPVIPNDVELNEVLVANNNFVNLTLVIGTQWSAWFDAQSIGITTVEYDLPLSYTAIAPKPLKLEALTYENANPNLFATGTALYPGYNVNLSAEGNDGIRLDIEAGSGEGLAPADCLEDCSPNYLTALNGTVKPTSSGAVFIGTKGCTSVTTGTSNNLQYSNDCEPCCDCADMAGTVERIRKDTNGTLLDTYNTLQTAIDDYRVDRYNFENTIRPSLELVTFEATLGPGLHPAVTVRMSNRGEAETVGVTIATSGSVLFRGFASTVSGINVPDNSSSFNVNFSLDQYASETLLVQVVPEKPTTTSCTVTITANGEVTPINLSWSGVNP